MLKFGVFATGVQSVAKRPPYMHDGSLGTLEEVVAFYNKGGTPNQWLSKETRPLNLTAKEQKDLLGIHGSANGTSCAGSIDSAEIARITKNVVSGGRDNAAWHG